MGASQDIALPYMTDQRHAEDTFFIVAEADHRFYKADCIPPEEWLQVAGQEHYGHDESVAAAALAKEASEAEPSAGSSSSWKTDTKRKREQSHAEPSAGQQRKYGAWEAGHKHMLPRQAVDELVTDELRGLVAMANLAARQGCGDFIWYSWNPCKQEGRRRQPGFGAQLVGVTRTGARIFAEEMHKQRPAHFDAFIFELGMHRMQDNSCYVYPAVGNFDSHESGTTPGTRESLFDNHWLLGQPVIPGPGWWVAR